MIHVHHAQITTADVCVCVCVRACVHACVRACVCYLTFNAMSLHKNLKKKSKYLLNIPLWILGTFQIGFCYFAYCHIKVRSTALISGSTPFYLIEDHHQVNGGQKWQKLNM